MKTPFHAVALGLACLFLCGAAAPLFAQDEPPAEEEPEKPKKKAKKKKEEKPSKYKFTGADPFEKTYRFDESGNPVQPKAKKGKKPKKPASEEDEIDGIAPLDDCGEGGESCKDKDSGRG